MFILSDFVEVLTLGKKWTTENNNDPDEPFPSTKYTATYQVVGDTTYDSKPAKIVFKEWVSVKHPDTPNTETSNGNCKIVLVEEAGKIYHNGELVYDINLSAGDSFEGQLVTEVGYIETPLGKLKRIHFHNLYDRYPMVLVEGIGLSADYIIRPQPITSYYEKMTACYYNETLVFTAEDFSKDSGAGINNLVPDAKFSTIIPNRNPIFYDLNGKQIDSNSKSTIVVTEGKKYLLR